MKNRPYPAELRIALLYALFGASWVLFSDRLLNQLFIDTFSLTTAQTFKGLGFVLLSALLIHLLLGCELARRKQAEHALYQSEASLKRSQAVAHVGHWRWNTRTNTVYWSDEMQRIFGLDPAAVQCDPSLIIEQAIHPEDRERVRSLNAAVIQGARAVNVEYRVVHPDGSVRHVWAVPGECLKDPAGQVLQLSGMVHDITELKQAEHALRLENERFQFLINSNIVGVVIADASGHIFTANDYYLSVLGLTRADFEAGRVDWRKATPPEWQAADARALRQLIETGRCDPYEKEYRRPDGTRVPVYIADAALPGVNGQIVAFVLDISNLKQAEEQTRRQLAFLTALREIDHTINSSSDMRVSLNLLVESAICLLNVDAVAVLLLDEAQGRLNFAAGQGFRSAAVQTASLPLSGSYAGQAVCEKRLVHLPDLRQESVNLLLTGTVRDDDFVGYSGLALTAKGRVIGVLELFDRAVVTRDAEWFNFFETLAGQAALAIHNAQLFESLQHTNTDLEGRVAERTAALNQANQELERANQIKDEFLATMSHELRTPLNSVLGLSESLLEQRRGPLNDYQIRSLALIHTSGRHLLELINDVLDLSKIEAGRFDYYPQVMEVESLCRASLAFVKEAALRKSISVRFQGKLPVTNMYADPRRLKQILINLLTNAVKFTPAGGAVMLQVEQDVENDRIHFIVQDTGIGIAPEDLQRLFQPFVQVDSRLTRQYEGTGLGLALVQRLTDLHGGSVTVESTLGQGSRFTVNLTMGQALMNQHRARAAVPEPQPGPACPNEPAAEPPEHGLILLADDNASNVLMVGDYLENWGYTVHVAHDGAEALDMAQAQPYDLILMDIQMPVMNGLEAIQRLRAEARFATTPIIALTALAMAGDRERCLEAGANEYISKPVALKSLFKTVRSFLHTGPNSPQPIP